MQQYFATSILSRYSKVAYFTNMWVTSTCFWQGLKDKNLSKISHYWVSYFQATGVFWGGRRKIINHVELILKVQLVSQQRVHLQRRVGVKENFVLRFTYIILISSEIHFCLIYVKRNKVKKSCFSVCFIEVFHAGRSVSVGLLWDRAARGLLALIYRKMFQRTGTFNYQSKMPNNFINYIFGNST